MSQYNQGTLLRAPINTAASGTSVVVSAGTGQQRVYVYGLFVKAAGACNVKFKDGPTTYFYPAFDVSAEAFVLPVGEEPWFITSPTNSFRIDLSAAVQTSGYVLYRYE